jgi:GNAT superfamily N-acetyltransferase
MDRGHEYRLIVQQVLQDYFRLYTQSADENLETFLVCDRNQDQYLLMRLGWEGESPGKRLRQRRINRTVLHLRLREGKVWVEEDWTEQGVATDLLAAGMAREAIVLGFQPPHLRQYTEFAAV